MFPLLSRRRVEPGTWRRKATNEGIQDTEIGKLASIVSDELKGISGARIRSLRPEHYAIVYICVFAFLLPLLNFVSP